MAKEKTLKKFVIIDSNSVIHRAYHALPPLTTKKGELVNALYGFLLVFLKVVKELNPTFIAATFDLPAPTFRHQKYKEYKATRPPTPENLCSQIPLVKEFLKVFNVPIFEKEGFEADDLIGTIVKTTVKNTEVEKIILSGDLDNLQMVGPGVKVYFLRKGVKDTLLYDKKSVKERFQGLGPEKLLDFKALRGDPTDNIPGVKGIGDKTAISLILKFGSLENLYKAIETNSTKAEIIKPSVRESLLKFKKEAFLSKELARIHQKTPIEFDLEKCRWGKYDKDKAIQLLKDLEFFSLIKRLEPVPKKGIKTAEVKKGEKINLKLFS